MALLNRAAAKFGGHCENDTVGSYITLQVCAPEGQEWVANGAAHIVVCTARGPQVWLDREVRHALEEIALGVCTTSLED